MGTDSEAKPELYQQTLGGSRRRRRGQVPRRGGGCARPEAAPGPGGSGTQWLSHSLALHVAPAPGCCAALPWHQGAARKGNITYSHFRLQPKGRPLGKNRRAWPTAGAGQAWLGCHTNHPTAHPDRSPEPPMGLTATALATAMLS